MTPPADETPSDVLDDEGRLCVDLACLNCGDNLRALAVTEHCLECGLRVAHSLRGTLDENGRVRANRDCLKCGYDLHSLSIMGRCPECGLPVAHSVRGNMLRYATPALVRRLASGAGRLYEAFVVAVISMGLGVLSALTMSHGGLGYVVGVTLGLAAAILVLSALIVAMVGLVNLTAHEQRVSLRAEGLSARRLCRAVWLASILALPIVSIVANASNWFFWRRLGLMLPAIYLLLLCGVLPLALLQHLTGLLRRVPSPRLVTHARGVRNTVVALDACLLAWLLASWLFGSRLAECAACLCLPLGLVCLVSALVVFRRAASALARSADQAAARNGST